MSAFKDSVPLKLMGEYEDHYLKLSSIDTSGRRYHEIRARGGPWERVRGASLYSETGALLAGYAAH